MNPSSHPLAPTPAVRTEGLWYSYDGSNDVLRDASISIGQGETVAVVGPNGGGKTTLLKLLLGLLRPDRGQVRVLGEPPRQVRSQIGYVPQHVQFDPKFPVSVLDVVRMGRLGLPGSGRDATDHALQCVGLAGQRSRAFADLSGGQRQRVLIARALASRPKLLLLDEPTANLDIGVEQEFQDLLADLAGQLTIVIVSHDIGFVSSRISKVLCVQGNVAVHPTQELSGRLLEEMYGGAVSVVHHDTHLAPDGGQEGCGHG